MSKIRIYELARELGIDNKQVILCAQRLGLADKSSHSNSLEDNEADLIRRAMIRHAMGSQGGSGAPQNVGSSRVSGSFGSVDSVRAGSGAPASTVVQRSVGSSVVVEQRQGNVVHRRRRHDEDDGSTASFGQSAQVQSGQVAPSTGIYDKSIDDRTVGDLNDEISTRPKNTVESENTEKWLPRGKVLTFESENLESEDLHSKFVKVDDSETKKASAVLGESHSIVKESGATPMTISEDRLLSSEQEAGVTNTGDVILKSVELSSSAVSSIKKDEIVDEKTMLTSTPVVDDKLDSSEIKGIAMTPVKENDRVVSSGPRVLGIISSIAQRGEARSGTGKSTVASGRGEFIVERKESGFHRRGVVSTTSSSSSATTDRSAKERTTAAADRATTTGRADSGSYGSRDRGLSERSIIDRPVVQERSKADRSGDGRGSLTPREPSRFIRAELPKTTENVVTDGGGPKVLGRIVLPTRKAAAAVTTAVGSSGRPEVRRGGNDDIIEDDDDTTSKKKGRARKREISRKDLIDYEGQDSRKGRGHKSSRGGRHGDNDDSQKREFTGPKASKRIVRVDEFITVGELARQMSLKAGDVIKKLIGLGVMATINQTIDKDTALIIAEEFGYQIESISFDEGGLIGMGVPEIEGELVTRPPLVTVMGHVDHGKTSLLDRIRKTSIADKEHGGITQHIGAYQVILDGDRRVSFLDTPGHAAFTAMRARGAEVTDIVVLVVAADDGVMPQTVEAINHAKAAGVPIIVAVNKMDKPSANPDRVKQQLAEYGLQPEEWGGDTMFVPVSALSGDGVEDLLEAIILLAEMKELKAVVDSRARGTILEASQERGFGTVATVLVQQGTLRLGDIFVAGSGFGRVRSIRDERGLKVDEVLPSMPVRVTGFDGAPLAGDDFIVVESDTIARQIADNRALRLATIERAGDSGPISLEEFQRRSQSRAAEELNVILKADVQGSVEAVKQAIHDLSTGKVIVKVLHSAVGGITESDIQLAIASNALVFGFGVRAEPRALGDAEAAGITVTFYRVIYELVDAVKKAMVGLLAPDTEEVPLGRAEVRDTFVVPKLGTIAGCYISDGIVKRGAFIRVVRDSRVVYQGKMGSLRRFKEDVKQVQSGYECGLGVENFNDVKVGDVFEVYELKEIAATL